MDDNLVDDRELLPVGKNEAINKLHHDISSILMDFVVHNQKPYSKTLSKLIATGCHDIRAGGVALDILVKVQAYLDEMKNK